MRIYFILILLIFSTCAVAQDHSESFNQSLADSLGADEYGMKMYIFVALKTGPVKISNPDSSRVLMRGHLDNISRLAQEGKIILAGPYGSNDLDFRGLFIFDSADTTEVRELLQTDPAIAAGVFETEMIPWYGSAALPTYLPNHSKIQKTSP